ncbi:heat-shock protein HtpX [Nocardia sp. NPDC057455]|uniref:arsenate reductase/protein-tyrosine-phosphatase family protein n=1 Tax=Nocardia sp. NPDC057455 TaxID=3346138 RepID=UPI00366D4F85
MSKPKLPMMGVTSPSCEVTPLVQQPLTTDAAAELAGSAPADRINPVVADMLREIGIDITDRKPKILTPEAVEASDVVITMGCGDACPYYPGKRYLDWKLDDPAGQDHDTVHAIRHQIERHVRTLLADLGITTT